MVIRFRGTGLRRAWRITEQEHGGWRGELWHRPPGETPKLLRRTDTGPYRLVRQTILDLHDGLPIYDADLSDRGRAA